MLENMMSVLSRIQEIRSRFHSAQAQGVVSIAPHAYPQPASGPGQVQPFFPEYLIEAAKGAAPAGPARPSVYDNLIESAAHKHGVDAALVKAVVRAESGFNPSAVSPAGARGLMQLMPSTAASLGVGDAFDPAANIDAGVRYLRQQMDTFDDVRLALAAYNAGPTAVVKYGGVPPFSETRNYINRVLSYRAGYGRGS